FASAASSAAAMPGSSSVSEEKESSSLRSRGFSKGSEASAVMGSAEEVEDALGEHVVEAEDEQRHDDHGHQDDDGRRDDLGLRRPGHLLQLATDLAQELLGGGALFVRRRGRRAPALGGRRRLAALALHLALGLSVHSRLGSIGAGTAGQEGIEPPTAGFGARCSAN